MHIPHAVSFWPGMLLWNSQLEVVAGPGHYPLVMGLGKWAAACVLAYLVGMLPECCTFWRPVHGCPSWLCAGGG